MLPLRQNYCIFVDRNRNTAYQYVSRGDLGRLESMARILIVDDDTLVLASVQMLLVYAGHDVVVVDQGSKAVLALESDHFDAVRVFSSSGVCR